MIRLPEKNKRFIQSNQSDVLGNIWSSYNLDLTDNIGRIRVGRKMVLSTSSENIAGASHQSNLGVPSSFVFYGGSGGAQNKWYALGSGRVFVGDDNANSPFVQDTADSTPTGLNSDSDASNFNGSLYVLGDAVYKLSSGGSWSSPSALAGFGGSSTVYNERLYFKHLGSRVISMNTSDTVATSGNHTLLLFPTIENEISSVESGSNRIWVATVNRTRRPGRVYEWDGVTENTVNKAIELDSMGALSLIIRDDVPWIMTTDGVLASYNGVRFIEQARLPINPEKYLISPLGGSPSVWLHHNGMTIVDGKINILINNENIDNTVQENLPSGIWEYDERIGLYHKHSLSFTNNGGQNRISQTGALEVAKNTSGTDGSMLAGARIFTDATNRTYGVWYKNSLDTLAKSGYLVSTKIESGGVEDIWQKIWSKHKIGQNDEIVVKYRVSEDDAEEFSITWTDDNIFTSTGNLSGIEVGDEVEVMQGQGGISHITAISESGGTYTVTVDEEISGITGTAKVRIQKWKKLGVMTASQLEELPIGEASTWIQIKILMKFTGNKEVEELIIVNQNRK